MNHTYFFWLLCFTNLIVITRIPSKISFSEFLTTRNLSMMLFTYAIMKNENFGLQVTQLLKIKRQHYFENVSFCSVYYHDFHFNRCCKTNHNQNNFVFRSRNCYKCLVITRWHKNILQYKESEYTDIKTIYVFNVQYH